jgi:RNA polymerase sigma factor (sigma-70 family)
VKPEETAGQTPPPPGPDPRAGLETFLEDYYRYFLTAATAVDASVDDAYEAVQATVKDMLEKETWSRLTRNPQAWVRKAVRHAYYDQQEKRRRSREIENLPPPSGSYLDSSPNVWEDWQWVEQHLSKLPPAQREVFELVLAELDTREIADLLGKTPATIRQNLAHARKRLKANLGQDYQIGPTQKRRMEDTP